MPRIAVAARATTAARRTITRTTATPHTVIDPTYLVSIFAYLPFVGAASQGSSGSAQSSNLAVSDANRKAQADSMYLKPGVAGSSYVATWEALEGLAPVNGTRGYDFTITDTAIQEAIGYGKKAMLRANAGSKLSSTNYIVGGGTGTLTVAAPEGTATLIHVAVRSDYRPPIALTNTSKTASINNSTTLTMADTSGLTLGMYVVGPGVNAVVTAIVVNTSVTLSTTSTGGQKTNQTYYFGQAISLTVTPGVNVGTAGQESFIMQSVGAPTGNVYPVTIAPAAATSHPIGTLVEWGTVPVLWTTATPYLIGDMVYAPPGSTMNDEGLDNRVYSVTKQYTSGASIMADLAAGASGPLSQTIVFADQSGDVMPCPWDPVALFNRIALIKALGARYNGNPYLYAMQCSGAGYLGEGTLNAGTAQQVVANWLGNGYSDRRYADAWKQYLDAYAVAFPTTPLCIDLDEPFGPTFNGSTGMPVTVTLAGTSSSSVNPQRILMASTTGVAVGQLVNGPGVVNGYVGSINPNVSVDLLVSPNSNWAGGTAVGAYNCPAATANGAPGAGTFQFGGRSFTLPAGTSDGAAPSTISITMPAGQTLDQGILGMAVTGGGAGALTFVGTLTGTAPNYVLTMSDRRTRQSGAKTLTAGSQTITVKADQLAYTNPYVIQRELTGRNTGGSLAGPYTDTWTTPTVQEAGYTGATYPQRFAVQQNGLLPADLGSSPQGRFRPTIAGSNAFSSGTGPVRQALLAHWGGGYQPHDGTAHSLQNVIDMMRLGYDDQVSYYELYSNDVTVLANAGTGLVTIALGTRI